MSEVSDFCHGIDTQSGMMTKSMVEKKYHKTLVVLVGGGGVGGGRMGGEYMGSTLPL